MFLIRFIGSPFYFHSFTGKANYPYSSTLKSSAAAFDSLEDALHVQQQIIALDPHVKTIVEFGG